MAEREPELTSRTQGLSYNGSDYMFVTSPKTWADARSYCLQQGYDLVTINDSGEEAFLEVEERNRGLYNWWIGFNDQSVEGQWSWASSSSSYANWFSGEPNNSQGNEDCAADRFRSPDETFRTELWNDDNCSRAYAFICERPTVKYNGSDYMFVTSPRTWADARSYCLQQGYDLVTINDSGEEAFLEVEERNRGLYNWWIGFNDQSVEGQWSWASSSSSYTNWFSGEPNNSQGNEDCAADRFRSPDETFRTELWNDDNCSRAYAFICERSTSHTISYNGSEYMFVTAGRPWAEARDYCRSYGYGLATINSIGEEAFLEAEERNRGLYNWWIGFNDVSVEGQWSWAHSSSTYVNWYPGQPDNYLEREDCAADRFGTPDGTIRSESWNDDNCDQAYAFICERASYPDNLLINPRGESGDLSGWTVLSNGGDGWMVGGMEAPGFHTSYEWATREQLIDLYAKGFDASIMAKVPSIYVAEKVRRQFCSDDYFIRVELLNNDMQIVHAWDTGMQSVEGPCNYSVDWRLVAHTFTDYGPSVRYLRFKDGGKDREWWAGHYGAVFNEAVVGVMAPVALYNSVNYGDPTAVIYLAEGDYTNLSGLQSVSSLRVDPEYIITLCTDNPFTMEDVLCQSFDKDNPDLHEAMEDKARWARVSRKSSVPIRSQLLDAPNDSTALATLYDVFPNLYPGPTMGLENTTPDDELDYVMKDFPVSQAAQGLAPASWASTYQYDLYCWERNSDCYLHYNRLERDPWGYAVSVRPKDYFLYTFIRKVKIPSWSSGTPTSGVTVFKKPNFEWDWEWPEWPWSLRYAEQAQWLPEAKSYVVPANLDDKEGLLVDALNNSISSIKVAPGYKVRLCDEHPRTHPGTACKWFYGDISDLTTLAWYDDQNQLVSLGGKVSYVYVQKDDAAHTPIVFVHGFLGWGPGEVEGGLKYWGGTNDVVGELNLRGIEAYAAAVGPVSSNWDRAAELYAQIKGTCTDYGFNHRILYNLIYGQATELSQPKKCWRQRAIYPRWDVNRPIHLIGHSMGGQTIRTLAYLLKHPFYDLPTVRDEKESPSYTKESLFYTPREGWVKSVTTISTPNNGTTLADILVADNLLGDFLYNALVTVVATGGASTDTKKITSLYDFKLDQYGLARGERERILDYFDRVRGSDVWNSTHKNIAAYSLSTEGARDENDTFAKVLPDVYYFSYATKATDAQNNPMAGMNPVFRPLARHIVEGLSWKMNDTGTPFPQKGMAAYTRAVGAPTIYGQGQVEITPAWFANDGVVNTYSMHAPRSYQKPPEELTATTQADTLSKGVWYKGCTLDGFDHMAIVGIKGPNASISADCANLDDLHMASASNNATTVDVHEFYYRHVKFLSGLR